MKLFGALSTAALLLVFGYSVPGYGQQNQQDEAKPAPQEEPKPEKQAKPREARPPEEGAQKPEERREQNAPAQGHEQQNKERNDARQAQESGRHSDRSPVAVGNRGGRIADDKFREHFGRSHTVVINRPVIVDNRPRFQYSGYWFEIIDPWPTDWAYSDECYIDFIDDTYYLFDSLHPGVRIALVVIM